jgi:cyanophycinase
MPRQLFLLGSNAAFDVAAEEFVPAAGGCDARIALLLQGGPGSQKHLPEYVRPWEKYGATQYTVVMPDANGRLNPDDVAAALQNATGIFVGGGHTATYRRLYATEPGCSLLRERYAAGIPIAGCSAGALIVPQICAFYPGESDDGALVAQELGLIAGFIVGVHFTERNILPHLLATMVASRTTTAWGIDESACVVFHDHQFKHVLGHAAYEITMTDFESRTYQMIER